MNWLRKKLYKRNTLIKVQEGIWGLEQAILINIEIIAGMNKKLTHFQERMNIEKELQGKLDTANYEDRQKLKKSKEEEADWQKRHENQEKEIEKGRGLIESAQLKIEQQLEKMDIIKRLF